MTDPRNDGDLHIREKYSDLAREVLNRQRVRLSGRPLSVLKTDAFNEAHKRSPIEDYAETAHVQLVENDEAVIAAARTNYPDLKIVLGDIRALPFSDQAFDVILDLSTIDHVPDPPRAIREYARCLRPGGALCLVSWVHLGRATQQRPSAYGGMQYFFDCVALRSFLAEHFWIEDGRILTPGLTGPYGGHDLTNVDVHAYLCRR